MYVPAGSALPGIDYVTSSTTILFRSGSSQGFHCLTVRILGEVGLERTKTFQVTLALTLPDKNVNVEDSRTEILIYDGMNTSILVIFKPIVLLDAMVFFDQQKTTVEEIDRDIQICARTNLLSNISRRIQVTLRARDGFLGMYFQMPYVLF